MIRPSTLLVLPPAELLSPESGGEATRRIKAAVETAVGVVAMYAIIWMVCVGTAAACVSIHGIKACFGG